MILVCYDVTPGICCFEYVWLSGYGVRPFSQTEMMPNGLAMRCDKIPRVDEAAYKYSQFKWFRVSQTRKIQQIIENQRFEKTSIGMYD